MFEEINDSIIKHLLEKKIISYNDYLFCKNIATTLKKTVYEILLEKSIITEEILFQEYNRRNETLYGGIIDDYLLDFLEIDNNIFEQFNLSKKNYSIIGVELEKSKVQELKESLQKKERTQLVKSMELAQIKQPKFLITNDPTHDEQTLGKLKTLMGIQNLKIHFLPFKKYAKFVSRSFKHETKMNQTIQLLNDSTLATNINENTTNGTLLNFMIYLCFHAIEQGASDIHIETDELVVNIRLRIDDVLVPLTSLQVGYSDNIYNIIKGWSNNLASEERDTPVDGQFVLKNEIDKEVKEHPIYSNVTFRWGKNTTIYGNHVVLRILNTDTKSLSLNSLGFNSNDKKIINTILKEPNGLILVTGPTGSGKTNTITAMLKQIANVGIKALSCEDPVEIKLPFVQQVQVNKTSGLDPSKITKSFLRQDPNIMFIGEIRDTPMARQAVEGSMTGHLMFATVHTNDALSAIIRLEELNISRVNLANILRMIVAQRLMRKLCPHCKRKINYKELLQKEAIYTHFSIGMGDYYLDENETNLNIYESAENGCEKCRHTGYNGRIPIAEIVIIDEKMRNEILSNKSPNDILKTIKTEGFKPLKEQASILVQKGLTDVNEAARVLGTTKDDVSFDYKSIY